jgi:hypothetical protein
MSATEMGARPISTGKKLGVRIQWTGMTEDG